MQILIIGFQRSGTTLLRRILSVHPHIKAMWHENFLLTKYKDKESLLRVVKSRGVSPTVDNWGEKCPYYPAIRKTPVMKYCKTWTEYFGDTSRILHIVRHPIDVSLSVKAKMKGKKGGSFDHSLNLYKNRMRAYVPKIKNMKNAYTFKYEDMLMNPDEVIPQIFEFCNLDKSINFREALSKIKNPRYRSINPSRAFAHKKNPPKIKTDLNSVYNVLNRSIGGVEYGPV